MGETHTFQTVNEALPFLCKTLLQRGDEVGSRNGRVKELLNTQVVIKEPWRREILTPNRKANVFAQIAETMWVLAGRNDIEWLSAYLPRAKDFSDDGETWRGGYGPRIREWGGWPRSLLFGTEGKDQLAHVIDLLRAHHLSRRAVIAIYDPSVDMNPGKDIPCNDFLQFQSRNGSLHLTVTVRSNDLMWGWSGINAFEWSTLQEIVARILGLWIGPLTFNIGSLHLYEKHWAKAERIVGTDEGDVRHIPFHPSPKVLTLEDVDHEISKWFAWETKCRNGDALYVDLDMKSPLFQAWAKAIAYYWTRDEEWLVDLQGTALARAIAQTPASVLSEAPVASRSAVAGAGTHPPSDEAVRAFYEFVKDLHATKHASYGDSWKKRGEQMSILANIARKVDRLGVGDEYDSSADTVIDLLVYLIKYSYWLHGRDEGPDNVNLLLGYMIGETEERTPEHNWQTRIREDFDHYADRVGDLDLATKDAWVSGMMKRVAPIARDLWLAENHDGNDYRGADAD